MERQPPYGDSNINMYVAQLQQIPTQRIEQHSGMSHFPGKVDSSPPQKEHSLMPSKAGGQWQWDRDARRVSNPMSSNPYIEGQGGNAAQTISQGRMPNPNVKLENVREPGLHYHEQDMEIGYEDKPAVLTYEGLEQRFMDEIIKLGKEQNDAEDAEHARHREKIMEINNQFLEKISTLRALQAKRREEFLLKEAQARLHHYQQVGMNRLPINQHPTAAAEAYQYQQAEMNHLPINQQPPAAAAHRGYAIGQFDSYREGTPFLGGGRNQQREARVPTDQFETSREGTPFLGDGRNQQREARVPTDQFQTSREGTPFLGDGRNQRTEARVPIPQGRVYNNARNY